ncbi:LysR family transcriptional regulator [Methylophilaceae bacterium]|nr:LysR family transcriptional regulator [Methylophilaceae bacterium]|tara:strand:+ start:3895 stop:4791 length:897 start_codon:yes stop_codon:yes gene_type:complete
MLDWNDLRSFLELARRGKLTMAGKRLNVEPTTVGRHINRLETELEVHLFDRSPKGYSLNDEGYKLLPYAENIETKINSIYQSISGTDTVLTGTVRMAVPEGLGIGVISKYIKDFKEQHPAIELELVADTRSRSLSKREADIAITLARPSTGRLIAWKLGEYRLALYASQEYLNNNSKIKSVKDLTQHSFISYIDDLIEFPQLKYMQDLLHEVNIVFRSSSLQAQYQAVIDGIGLALLHGFVAADDKKLQVILSKKIFATREYWMVVHEDLYKLARVQAVSRFFTDVIKKEQDRLMRIA